jgi:hypothetical protein
MTNLKVLTMKDWPKTQLIEAIAEERELKHRVAAERDTLRDTLQNERREVQSLKQKLSDTQERERREQSRADSAEAALQRAHEALVIAVRRLEP